MATVKLHKSLTRLSTFLTGSFIFKEDGHEFNNKFSVRTQADFKCIVILLKGVENRIVHLKMFITSTCRGAPMEPEPFPHPWNLKTTRFSVFLALNYVILVFATRVLELFCCVEGPRNPVAW